MGSKKKENELLQLLGGLLMMVAGFYFFTQKVTVTTGFGALRVGRFNITTGLVVIPFIAGIICMFVTDSWWSKFLTIAGLIIIVASIIAGTNFYFVHTSLYEYLIMLVLMFGGLGLTCKVLLKKPNK